mgnify:CR=1 FL=1
MEYVGVDTYIARCPTTQLHLFLLASGKLERLTRTIVYVGIHNNVGFPNLIINM